MAQQRISQTQELSQQQHLLPMQVQLVRMLEMTPAEIELEVTRAIEEMPALETDNSGEYNDRTEDGEGQFNETADQLQQADYGSEDDIPHYRLDAHNHSADDKRYEPIAVNAGPTLAEYLEEQLDELSLSERERLIATYIIGNLDNNGYLQRDLSAIATDIEITDYMEVGEKELNKVFSVIRSLDPAGVGAINLRDCLSLQLKRLPQNEKNKIAVRIIDQYYDLFIKKHFKQLASALSISEKEVKEAIETILHLDPKPGGAYSAEAARNIIPEFSVESDGNNLTVTLLDNIPELSISESFRIDPIAGPNESSRAAKDAITFVRNKRDEAVTFIKTLSLRQQTLFNVMKAIVEIQTPFFKTGEEIKLRPMILKDIAARTGYDLSVISRATASKYVITANGIYPLKYFFNERPKEDEDVSFHQIAAALRKIIDEENKKSPLSDEAITKLLKKEGYNVARRTVSKYREKLGIPVARLRRN